MRHRHLEGSCQCGGVQFELQSNTPVPYQLCACSICRKVAGYNGSVNLGGLADTLKIKKGKELIKSAPYFSLSNRYQSNGNGGRKYNAIKNRGKPDEETCSSERSFCSNCSTMLWLWDHHWPELIHPFAPAIDTELPVPDEMVCIMDSSKPAYVRWPEGKKTVHKLYGNESLEGWHKKHNLYYE